MLISLHPPPWMSSLQIASGLTYFCLLSCKFQLSWLEPFRAGFLPAKCQTFLPHSSEASNKPKDLNVRPSELERREKDGLQCGMSPSTLQFLGAWVFTVSNKRQKEVTFARHDLHIWVNTACFSQAGNGSEKETWILEEHAWWHIYSVRSIIPTPCVLNSF